MRDVDYLRHRIRAAFRADIPPKGSTLADMQTNRAKGEMLLKRSRGTHVVHATATRPSGYSREIITREAFTAAREVRAVWTLPSGQIQSILAHYSPSAEMRRISRAKLATRIASEYPTRMVRSRAQIISLLVLDGVKSSGDMMNLFELNAEQWRNSRHRRIKAEVQKRIHEIDVESLLSWERACGEMRGKEIV